MKKYILPAIAILAAASASAEVYNYLTIKQADKVISIPIEDVVNVKFTVDDQTTQEVVNPEYTLRVLTFEDEDYMGSGNYLGQKNWSSLIDTPQYGGPLLYGEGDDKNVTTAYNWYDQNNTELWAAVNPDPEEDEYVFWFGGNAVSNYVGNDYKTVSYSYTDQLAVPGGGCDGSKNFCVHYGDNKGWEPAGIWFKDGVARVIDHMYVINTSYALSTVLVGDGFSEPAKADDWAMITAVGFDANGDEHQATFYLLKDGKYVDEWTKWDLSSLGEVKGINFSITSSIMNDWGMAFPGYFAIDNIAVRFPNEQ